MSQQVSAVGGEVNSMSIPDKPFKCSECDSWFTTNAARNIHSKKHSMENIFKCNICFYVTKDYNDLRKHRLNKCSLVKPKLLRCHACDFKCNEKENLKSHFFTKHMQTHMRQKEKNNFACTSCDFMCNSQSKIKKHIEEQHSDQDANIDVGEKYSCVNCEFTCYSTSMIKNHISEKHSDDNLSPINTQDDDDGNEDDQKNYNIEEGNDNHNFLCLKCNVQFPTEKGLNVHMGMFHSDLVGTTRDPTRIYKCPICEYKGTWFGFKKHFKIHRNQSMILKSLMKTLEKEYACKMCDFKCTTKLDFRSHMEVSHFIFSCTNCHSHNCNTKADLQRHMSICKYVSIHEQQQQFSCPECKDSFDDKIEFMTHNLIHTGGKPFTCTKCKAQFLTDVELIIHMESHELETDNLKNQNQDGDSDIILMESHKLETTDNLKYHNQDNESDIIHIESHKLDTDNLNNDNHEGVSGVNKTVNNYSCENCEFTCNSPSKIKNHISEKHSDDNPSNTQDDDDDDQDINSDSNAESEEEHDTDYLPESGEEYDTEYLPKRRKTDLKEFRHKVNTKPSSRVPSKKNGIANFRCFHIGCNFISNTYEGIKRHVKIENVHKNIKNVHHMQKLSKTKEKKKYRCFYRTCNFTAYILKGVMIHAKKSHKDYKYINNIKNVKDINEKCSQCDYMGTVKGLKMHTISWHNRRKHSDEINCKDIDNKKEKCPQCPYTGTVKGLKMHTSKAHNSIKLFTCNKCNLSLKSSLGLHYHNRRKHGDDMNCEDIDNKKEKCPQFSCNKCNISFVTQHGLKNHSRAHSDVNQFECKQCDFSSLTQKVLDTHIDCKHGNSSCLECDYVGTVKGLKSHSKAHTTVKPFTCEKCGFSCFTQKVLNTHIGRKHGDEAFACSECDYKGTSFVGLARHTRKKHKKALVKPFTCEQCEFSCLTQKEIDMHMCRKHRDEVIEFKEEKCPECDYIGTVKGLKCHSKAHTVKPFTCEHCELSFLKQKLLDIHLIRKHGNKALACTECDYVGNSLIGLSCHYRMLHKDLNIANFIRHGSHRLLNCGECNISFINAKGLKNHMHNAHSSAQIFYCPKCDYNCSTEIALRRHTSECENSNNDTADLVSQIVDKDYTEGKPYNNYKCMDKFHSSFELNNHMDSHELDSPCREDPLEDPDIYILERKVPEIEIIDVPDFMDNSEMLDDSKSKDDLECIDPEIVGTPAYVEDSKCVNVTESLIDLKSRGNPERRNNFTDENDTREEPKKYYNISGKPIGIKCGVSDDKIEEYAVENDDKIFDIKGYHIEEDMFKEMENDLETIQKETNETATTTLNQEMMNVRNNTVTDFESKTKKLIADKAQEFESNKNDTNVKYVESVFIVDKSDDNIDIKGYQIEEDLFKEEESHLENLQNETNKIDKRVLAQENINEAKEIDNMKNDLITDSEVKGVSIANKDKITTSLNSLRLLRALKEVETSVKFLESAGSPEKRKADESRKETAMKKAMKVTRCEAGISVRDQNKLANGNKIEYKKSIKIEYLCDQCDFKTLCEVVMKKHYKNIHKAPLKFIILQNKNKIKKNNRKLNSLYSNPEFESPIKESDLKRRNNETPKVLSNTQDDNDDHYQDINSDNDIKSGGEYDTDYQPESEGEHDHTEYLHRRRRTSNSKKFRHKIQIQSEISTSSTEQNEDSEESSPVELREISEKEGEVTKEPYWCDICKLSFKNTPFCIAIHNKAVKHQMKVTAKELIQKLKETTDCFDYIEETGLMKCKQCKIYSSTPTNFETHINSTKHKISMEGSPFKRKQDDDPSPTPAKISRCQKVLSAANISKETNETEQLALDPGSTPKKRRITSQKCLNDAPQTNEAPQANDAQPTNILNSSNIEFKFLQHCLFCGKDCLPKDPRNPSRWRTFYTFKKNKKQELLNICLERKDELAEEVYIRIQNTMSDLPDLGAQYHFDCYQNFTGKVSISAAASRIEKKHSNDLAFHYIVDTLQNDPTKLWNSVEIHDIYRKFLRQHRDPSPSKSTSDPVYNVDDNDIELNRQYRPILTHKLINYFGNKIIVVRQSGSASIICFRAHLPVKLKLIKLNDNDNISKLSKIIAAQVKLNPSKTSHTYDLNAYTIEEVKDAQNNAPPSNNCLICGKDCIPKDPKRPRCWRKFSTFKTVSKQKLFEVCDERGDQFAEEVRVRVQGIDSDLPASGVQYHIDCLQRFYCKD